MMRNIDKYHLHQCLLLLGCLLYVPHSVQAQAWGGGGDTKVYVGYVNVGGKTGLEIGSDYTLSDFISIGERVTYVNVKKHDEGHNNFLLGYDLSLTDNHHWAGVLKPPSVLDVYNGVSVGLRTISLQAGVRYNFSETFGLHGWVRQNLFETLGDDVEHGHAYQDKTALSVGPTVTF